MSVYSCTEAPTGRARHMLGYQVLNSYHYVKIMSYIIHLSHRITVLVDN